MLQLEKIENRIYDVQLIANLQKSKFKSIIAIKTKLQRLKTMVYYHEQNYKDVLSRPKSQNSNRKPNFLHQ